MNKLYIENRDKASFKNKRLYKKIFKTTLNLLEIEGRSEVNVIIINNKEIKAISKQYKKKDKATDVLSFPSDWQELKNQIGYNMFGDIFISHEKVTAQAKKFGHSEKREWGYLFVHGLLHLIGYDHLNKKDEKEMNGLAKMIMTKVGVERHV